MWMAIPIHLRTIIRIDLESAALPVCIQSAIELRSQVPHTSQGSFGSIEPQYWKDQAIVEWRDECTEKLKDGRLIL